MKDLSKQELQITLYLILRPRLLLYQESLMNEKFISLCKDFERLQLMGQSMNECQSSIVLKTCGL